MNKQINGALAQGDQTPVVLVGADSNEVRISSVELVEMINTFRAEEGNETEKRHDVLLRDIRSEIDVLEKAGIAAHNFVESVYLDKQNQERPCYSLNKAGVLQILNKESAVVRYKTVQYIEKLEKEKQPQLMSMEDIIIYQMEQSKAIKQQLEETKTVVIETKQEVQAMREVINLDPAAWRVETTNLINKIAQKLGGNENIHAVRKESYELLDSRAKAKLNIRQTNMRRKVLEETGSTSKANKISKLDVIASEGRLREIYIAIVKEMAIKYGVA